SKSPVIQSRIFVTSYVTELNLYLRSGDFDRGIPLVKEIEEGLIKFGDKINKESEVLFYYNIAYLYFGIGDYENSLNWNNKIINDKELNIREDLQCFSRILNLLIHYELKNYELIEYIVKSTRRYLSNKNNLSKFEITVLNFLRKLISASKEEEKNYIFNLWKKELRNIAEDILEIKVFEYFDFISWLESKIEGKKFQEIVKRK
ncbi:MAG: hypothetical protein JNJ56_08365, partial [Ignavibacteria bacterium]|nr:hypothetical protein [Ignavibacteria bacterium]